MIRFEEEDKGADTDEVFEDIYARLIKKSTIKIIKLRQIQFIFSFHIFFIHIDVNLLNKKVHFYFSISIFFYLPFIIFYTLK